jgi:hypothetical protein
MALGTESDGLDASSATGLPGSASLVRFDIPIDGWRDIGKSEKTKQTEHEQVDQRSCWCDHLQKQRACLFYVVTRALQQRLIISPVKLQAKVKEQLSSAQKDDTFHSDSLVQISSE